MTTRSGPRFSLQATANELGSVLTTVNLLGDGLADEAIANQRALQRDLGALTVELQHALALVRELSARCAEFIRPAPRMAPGTQVGLAGATRAPASADRLDRRWDT
jgi:hypothetical protein